MAPLETTTAFDIIYNMGAADLHDIYDPKATDLPLHTRSDISANHQEFYVKIPDTT